MALHIQAAYEGIRHLLSGQDSTGESASECCRKVGKRSVPDFIAVNDIVKLIQIDSLAVPAAEFDPLRKNSPDNIIGESDVFAELFPIFCKFFIYKGSNPERHIPAGKLLCELPG